MGRTRKTVWRWRIIAVLLLAAMLAAGWGWWQAAIWHPARAEYPQQGALVRASDGTVDFTVSGLDDTVAYRVTLVVADNITLGGDGAGTFVDGDANGAADAGASEAVALIAMVNGAAIDPAKTYPGGDDDPSAPSAIFPSGGELSVQLVGVGAGAVHPVVYENGGASTFLELDGSGAPVEVYLVGPAVAVQ